MEGNYDIVTEYNSNFFSELMWKTTLLTALGLLFLIISIYLLIKEKGDKVTIIVSVFTVLYLFYVGKRTHGFSKIAYLKELQFYLCHEYGECDGFKQVQKEFENKYYSTPVGTYINTERPNDNRDHDRIIISPNGDNYIINRDRVHTSRMIGSDEYGPLSENDGSFLESAQLEGNVFNINRIQKLTMIDNGRKILYNGIEYTKKKRY